MVITHNLASHASDTLVLHNGLDKPVERKGEAPVVLKFLQNQVSRKENTVSEPLAEDEGHRFVVFIGNEAQRVVSVGDEGPDVACHLILLLIGFVVQGFEVFENGFGTLVEGGGYGSLGFPTVGQKLHSFHRPLPFGSLDEVPVFEDEESGRDTSHHSLLMDIPVEEGAGIVVVIRQVNKEIHPFFPAMEDGCIKQGTRKAESPAMFQNMDVSYCPLVLLGSDEQVSVFGMSIDNALFSTRQVEVEIHVQAGFLPVNSLVGENGIAGCFHILVFSCHKDSDSS